MMAKSIKTFCLIFAFCVVTSFTPPVPSYAASDVSTSNTTGDQANGSGAATSPDQAQNPADQTQSSSDQTQSPSAQTQSSSDQTQSPTDQTQNPPAPDEKPDGSANTPSDKDKDPADGSASQPAGDASEADKNPVPVPEDDESLWYSKELPMKKEYQKLLWDYCKKRNLDYIDMLALISTESNFYEKCSSGIYKGYFQINKYTCAKLAKQLKTPNKPLDGSININWGTKLFSWIMSDKRVKNLQGKKKLDAALSIYQRGTGGYDKYGINYKYLKIYYKKHDIVMSYFKKDK